MNNSTFLFKYTILTQKKLMKLFLFISLYVFSTLSWGQAVSPVVSNPGQPLDAPQQFTTNLVGISNLGNTTIDGTINIFALGFSNDIDGSDAIKLANPHENIGLLRNNQTLMIEARQPVISRDTIFYRLWNLKQQQYQLEIYPINMNLPGLSAIIVDRYLNTITPVNLITSPSNYTFTVTADVGSFAEDRFIIVFVQVESGPLPVNFINIAATPNRGNVLLSWMVAGERGIKNYQVERSANGRNFNTIGAVEAIGYNSSEITYSLSDAGVQSGTYFYRVKSNGVSGEIKFSPVVKVIVGGTKSTIIASPNPVVGNSINLQLVNQPKGQYNVRIIDINGKPLLKSTFINIGGNNLQTIQTPSSVAPGIYQLEILDAHGNKQVQSLLFL